MNKNLVVAVCVFVLSANIASAESVVQPVDISADTAPMCSANTGLKSSWALAEFVDVDTGKLKSNLHPKISLGSVTCTSQSYLSIVRTDAFFRRAGTSECTTSGAINCLEYLAIATWENLNTTEGNTAEIGYNVTNRQVSGLFQPGSGDLTLELGFRNPRDELLDAGHYVGQVTVQVGKSY